MGAPQTIVPDAVYHAGWGTSRPKRLAGATNYVAAALEEAKAGKPVAVTTSRPYGCSVKYAQ